MKTSEIREKFIKFFVDREHKEITPAPLVLRDDPSTLFVSAGMQPLVPYLKGKKHPDRERLVNSQPCLRMEDIDEIGDSRHTTYFEMLGNWSLGDYWKKEQLNFFWEFLTGKLRLNKDKLHVTVFEGDKNVSKDEESYGVWRRIGVSEDHIFYYGATHNWWSSAGSPDKMEIGDIGGPDSEVFYDFGKERIHEKSAFKDQKCHPNCGCGRFLEIGNSVFIQYTKKEDGSLEELDQKNVDFGAGLERLAASVSDERDIFKLDEFGSIMAVLEKESGVVYGGNLERDAIFRIVADHVRAIVALVGAGIKPSNKMHGYVLRRLVRRAFVRMRKLSLKKSVVSVLEEACAAAGGGGEAGGMILREIENFEKVLSRGIREVSRDDKIKPFDLFQSWGVPWEMAEEIYAAAGRALSGEDKKEFEQMYKEHKKKSSIN